MYITITANSLLVTTLVYNSLLATTLVYSVLQELHKRPQHKSLHIHTYKHEPTVLQDYQPRAKALSNYKSYTRDHNISHSPDPVAHRTSGTSAPGYKLPRACGRSHASIRERDYSNTAKRLRGSSHQMAFLFAHIYVAVPDRIQILFCRVF